MIYESKKISPIVIERMSKNVSLHNMRYPLILSQRVRILYRKTDLLPVFRRSTMKVSTFSNFLIHLKSLRYLKNLDFTGKFNILAGHFLICCLSLFLLRILEIKCFKNKLSSYDLVNFMRDFRVADKGDGT